MDVTPKRKTKIENQHPWWHKLFENLYRVRQYRDGFLGRQLTPDIDEHSFNCSWPGCRYHKTITEVLQ